MSRLRPSLVTLAALPLAVHASQPCGPLARGHEHVVLRASELGRLRGPRTSEVAILAMRDGRIRPIPFQLDECRGSKPVLQGPGALADQAPGRFDRDDVLVLMPCDAGDRIARSELARWRETFGARQWREVTITDPLDGSTAWIYVVVAPHAPRAADHYIHYDRADVVTTATYRIGMEAALPSHFSLPTSDEPERNLLDGLHLRAEGLLRAHLATITFTERDASHRLVAWGAGPLRVVRRSEHDVNIALGFRLAVGTAHTYFHPRRITGPGRMSLPISPGLLFEHVAAAGGVDLAGLTGWTYHAQALDRPFTIDGRSDDDERAVDAPGHWFLLRRGDQAILTVMRASPNLSATAPLHLLYLDDAAASRAGERLAGSAPLVGFRAPGLEALPPGRYRFVFDVLFEPAYRPGREHELLAQLAHPLEARLSGRSDPATSPAGRP